MNDRPMYSCARKAGSRVPMFADTTRCMPRVERVYKRDELYERVWSKPMRDVAKEYGVSDVALKKMCRKLDVPTPPQGHWNRVAAGHDVVRPVLRPLGEKERDRIVISWWQEHEPIAPTDAALVTAAAERSTERIVVGPSLDNPHPLVSRSAKLLAKAKPFDELVSSRAGGLHINVAPPRVERALRIMDALIKALAARGLTAEVTPPDPKDGDRSRTRVEVHGLEIEFGLTETVKITPPPVGPPRKPRHLMTVREYFATPHEPVVRRPRIATGNLTLTIFSGEHARHWRDREHRKLETFLNEFIAHLFIAADWLKQKSALDEERRRQEREEQRRREEERHAAAEEKKRVAELHKALDRWRLARDLRAFASDIRGSVVAASMKVTENGPLHDYIAFVMDYADDVDPLASLREELENGANRSDTNTRS